MTPQAGMAAPTFRLKCSLPSQDADSEILQIAIKKLLVFALLQVQPKVLWQWHKNRGELPGGGSACDFEEWNPMLSTYLKDPLVIIEKMKQDNCQP